MFIYTPIEQWPRDGVAAGPIPTPLAHLSANAMDERGPTNRVLLDVEDEEQRQARIRRLGLSRIIVAHG